MEAAKWLSGVELPFRPRSGAERVAVALEGVSAELAELKWDFWHEDSSPWGPGQVILVDGDPRDVYPDGLEHPTLLGKPRA